MKKQLTITYEETTVNAVHDDRLTNLISETINFAQNAYAPYSNFKVSAGLLLSDGTILKGTNVENASYPVSICAERTLLSHAVSNYPSLIITDVVVYVDKDLPNPVPPCGLCRQTLSEVEQRQKSPIKIWMVAQNGRVLSVNSTVDLLPWSFTAEYLD